MTREGYSDAKDTTDAVLPPLELAMALHRAGKLEEALGAYARVPAADPGHADALYNRSQILQGLGRLDEALEGFARVVALQPRDADALRAQGVLLQAFGRHEEALASLDASLDIAPAHAGAWTARGAGLHALGRLDEALAAHARAQSLAPEDALAYWNESLCRLAMGDYARGWELYEWRWKWPGFPSPRLPFREPLWLGRENLAGKAILLHAEQGLGDTLQFARYATLVAARGATVYVMAQRLLLPLLEGLPGAARVFGAGAPLPRIDFHAPLLSLPHAFGTTLDTVPAEVPYLRRDPAAVAAWHRRLAPKGERLVGLCWRGSAAYRGDRDRSIALQGLAPLLDLPGLRFVGLQKELTPEEAALVAGRGNFVNPAEDFAATADIVAALDLVITVDTAFAHVAGALARPTWVLLSQPCHWCWMQERSDSPWYPTARLFRQQARGDWEPAIVEVADAARALAKG